ncbi:hypothetical protein GCM10009037_00470 [Halarchaeum grantii]|uniref:histidine kinase n=1 Tax=Halarchaeum grantii TaxID=1193105 RepID=A0A830EXS3_9EURY|nr:PAS domain S-box protein [Halarchaeum grantii]GGL21088.1 hypothetical protein GCM10009037_00470 [Halarchaeum grantii]
MNSERGVAESENATARAFREAVECSGHSIYWTDTTGRIEYVNDAFEKQTGYAADEAVGNNANILQSGVHDDRFYERLWDTILSGEVWEGEIVNERKDGERYVARQTISPVTDDDGDVVRFVAVNEDVTDLREYRKRLERQRDRLETVLDAVPVPLVLTDADPDEPMIKQMNRAFRETFGYTERELGRLRLDDRIVDDDDAEEAREITAQAADGERVRREVTRRNAAGERRTFLLEASTVTGEAGDEVIATYLDITDRKRAQEELERQTAELERFADVVSHDLRNPLNVAAGHLDLLDAEVDNERVDTIRAAHGRMRELIENLLMLAKQGRTIDETEPVAVSDAARRSWETIGTAGATLRVESTATIRADESRLGQLFGNLFRNAVEHGTTGASLAPADAAEDGAGTVTVTVGDLEDGFYVADDGPGIPDSERERVFETGHTSAADGTGLGLSIVAEIADAHGWDVTVTESDTGGARFEFTGVTCLT